MLGRRMDEGRANARIRWVAAMVLGLAFSAGVAAQDAGSTGYDTQDARLNAAYKALSASLDNAGRNALRDEERQWIAGRDQACGVTPGAVVKNTCTTTQTSFRADELEKRVRGATTPPAKQGAAAIAGDWGYRTECNLGHFVQLHVSSLGAAPEGTWSDGNHSMGSSGRFKGEWRDGKLYLRFCADETERDGYPACPAFGNVDGYVVPEGKRLAWYHADSSKYVSLDRVAKGGKAPLDKQCKDDM
ncbi:lysozyme inhibitor LprI family protein [Luteibacter sp. NPDC031894]|uniref:lysozyme inhibitor LprI family protein n=1 Tax=Luteibacter sp. NPDC031894 TaxID=3390572 RepID=UPI003CFD9C7C